MKILLRMRIDRHAAVRQQASESLWLLDDPKGLEDLVGLASSQHPDDQMLGLLGLAGRHDSRVVEHVRAGLSADYEEVKLAAARAMAMVTDERGPYDLGLPAATRDAQSREPRQRVLAARAIGAIGRTDTQETLRAMLKDPDANVRIAAATALLEIGKSPRKVAG